MPAIRPIANKDTPTEDEICSQLLETIAPVVKAPSIGKLNFIWLEITSKCNLTCTHCYADSGPTGALYGNMAYNDWSRVIDEAALLGCRQLQFIGGEPTLHPRLHDLVDHANHRGFELIEVFTNATRIGKDLLGCFQRNNVNVATSFYSDDPATHEVITQAKGSWDRTISGIRSVVAAGLPIRVGVIESERNRGHGPRAIEFVKRLGVANVGLDRERGVGRSALVQISSDEQYEELCGQCWKGRLCVTPTGEAFPCVFARKSRLGDVRLGLAGILGSVKLAHFRQKVRQLEEGRGVNASSCDPNTQCSPHNCNPTLPCSPQGPFCSPDSKCGPNTTCQPDNR